MDRSRQRPFRDSKQKRQKTGRSSRGLNGSRIGRWQPEQMAGKSRSPPSTGPGAGGRESRRSPLRRDSNVRAFRSFRRATRQSGQRGDTGSPLPRRAAISACEWAKASPQSTQTARLRPVRTSTSSGCNLTPHCRDCLPDRLGAGGATEDRLRPDPETILRRLTGLLHASPLIGSDGRSASSSLRRS